MSHLNFRVYNSSLPSVFSSGSMAGGQNGQGPLSHQGIPWRHQGLRGRPSLHRWGEADLYQPRHPPAPSPPASLPGTTPTKTATGHPAHLPPLHQQRQRSRARRHLLPNSQAPAKYPPRGSSPERHCGDASKGKRSCCPSPSRMEPDDHGHDSQARQSPLTCQRVQCQDRAGQTGDTCGLGRSEPQGNLPGPSLQQQAGSPDGLSGSPGVRLPGPCRTRRFQTHPHTGRFSPAMPPDRQPRRIPTLKGWRPIALAQVVGKLGEKMVASAGQGALLPPPPVREQNRQNGHQRTHDHKAPCLQEHGQGQSTAQPCYGVGKRHYQRLQQH